MMTKKLHRVAISFFFAALFFACPVWSQTKFAYTELPGISIAFQCQWAKGKLYIGTQPSGVSIPELARKGIKTIVSLRPAKDIAFNEKEIAHRHKMDFYDFHFSRDDVDFKELKSLARLLERENRYPMLIHGDDMELVAFVMAIKAIEIEGVAIDQGLAIAQFLGLRDRKLINSIRSYVRDY